MRDAARACCFSPARELRVRGVLPMAADWWDTASGISSLLAVFFLVGAAVMTLARRSFRSDTISKDLPELEAHFRSHETECLERGRQNGESLKRLELELVKMNGVLTGLRDDVSDLRRWKHRLDDFLMQTQAIQFRSAHPGDYLEGVVHPQAPGDERFP